MPVCILMPAAARRSRRSLRAGVSPERIQLTAQQVPDNLKALVTRGVLFNACSIAQIHAFGALFPGRQLSLRVNPGLGSGHNNRTNVAALRPVFGIWHEHLDEALTAGRKYGLQVHSSAHAHWIGERPEGLATHVALMSLDTCSRLRDVTVLNLGGGI